MVVSAKSSLSRRWAPGAGHTHRVDKSRHYPIRDLSGRITPLGRRNAAANSATVSLAGTCQDVPGSLWLPPLSSPPNPRRRGMIGLKGTLNVRCSPLRLS